jgi:uncharacterized membrane protein YqhA
VVVDLLLMLMLMLMLMLNLYLYFVLHLNHHQLMQLMQNVVLLLV